jgi:uncharacterized protein YkwD
MCIRTVLRGARLRLGAATVALGLAGAGCLTASTAALAAAADPVLDPQEQAVCQQINAYRASKGLAALKVSAPLTRAAKWMSLDMAANDYLDHIDTRGRDSVARIRTFGFHNATMSENLAGGREDAVGTFSQWRSEPAHRRNMLRAQLKVIGIGRAYRADSMLGWYWTATFGAGRSPAVAC